jgi:ketosteroid isomerase-like protein
MSSVEQNVQVISRLYEAFGRGDIPGVLGYVDEHATWVNIYGMGIFPGQWGKPCHNHNEIMSFFGAINDAVEVQGFTVSDVISQGDKVVAICPWKGVTRKTNQPYEVTLVHIWTLKNGKVVDYKGLDDPSVYAF